MPNPKKKYRILKKISEDILKKCGMMPEPTRPVNRIRPWQERGPTGVLYHYTGGPIGLKSMKWANKPSWGNTVSSWHVTVLDRVEDDIIGNLWLELCPDWLLELFPVPTIIMASWEKGTHHGNWSNKFLLGVENRNSGYYGYKKLKNGLLDLGKSGIRVGRRIYEPYTREQLIANINIGKLAKEMFNQFNPDDILSHQCIWATKKDAGPLFPIHNIRDAIFGNSNIRWLNLFQSFQQLVKNIGGDDYDVWVSETESRGDFEDFREISDVYASKFDTELPRSRLTRLGYNTVSFNRKSFLKAVRYFQKSTYAYKRVKKKEDLILKVDGIYGINTHRVLDLRLKGMGLL